MAPPPGTAEFSPLIMDTFKKAMELVNKVLALFKKAWNKLMNGLNSVLDKIRHQLNNDGIFASITEWVTDTLKDAVERIQSGIRELQGRVNTLLGKLQEVADKSVPVLSLFNTGLAWPTKVNAPLSILGNEMGGEANTAYWDGPTKRAYEMAVKTQNDAVKATVGKVKFTSEWLAGVGAANTTYMTELAGRIAVLEGRMTAVGISAASATGGALTQIPFALDDLAELGADVVREAAQFMQNLANRLAEVIKQITAIANEVTNKTDLGDGNWPQSVKG